MPDVNALLQDLTPDVFVNVAVTAMAFDGGRPGLRGPMANVSPRTSSTFHAYKPKVVAEGEINGDVTNNAGNYSYRAVDVAKTDVFGRPIVPNSAGGGGSPVILDLFGGRTSQIPGAINIDIVAEQGIRASALKLPIKPGIADQVISSNPYLPNGTGIMDWLPGATDTLKPGGQLIINYTAKNKFGQLPSADVLESLGLRVVRDPGPLLPQFENNVFRFTDGTKIPNHKVMSTILEKTR